MTGKIARQLLDHHTIIQHAIQHASIDIDTACFARIAYFARLIKCIANFYGGVASSSFFAFIQAVKRGAERREQLAKLFRDSASLGFSMGHRSACNPVAGITHFTPR